MPKYVNGGKNLNKIKMCTKNNCCCENDKVIIKCCSDSNVIPTPLPPDPPTPDPDPPGCDIQCKMLRVTFSTLRVTDDGEVGKGDWTLNMEVNGIRQTQEFPDDYIDDDDHIPYEIGKSINVPIDCNTTELKIKIDGFERDGWLNGENDILPTAERGWSKAENFGMGQTFEMAASNSDAAYNVSVTISCAEETTALYSTRELISAYTARAKYVNQKRTANKKKAISVTESSALNSMIRKLDSRGWKLTKVIGENLLFKGFGKSPKI